MSRVIFKKQQQVDRAGCRNTRPDQNESGTKSRQWTTGVCPNCGYTRASVDPDGILWCPACGYSRKGIYT